MTLLKINRHLPIYISIVLLNFEVDIQSQSKVRVRKPKNPIWPPGGHFEKVTLLKINRLDCLCRLQTDGRTDVQTDRQGESSIPPPPLQLRWAGV